VSESTKQITAWLDDETDGAREVRIPTLTDAVVDRLLTQPKLLRAFLKECIRPLVYDFAQRFCARTRGHVVLGDDILGREQVDKAIRRLRPRWESWLEHVGDRHIRLVEMTADDLLAAALLRERRAATDVRYAGLWREMAARMAPGQTVGQAFGEEELVEWFARLRVAA
jgi:hypothetical protein